jgi:hypothetical protein
VHPRAIELLTVWCERHCQAPMDTLTPAPITGWQVVEALWPLNEAFRPNYLSVRGLRYQAAYELRADAAIERYLDNTQWGLVSVETLRVLLERHQQSLMVAMLNEASGNSVMSLPETLPTSALTGAAMIWMLYAMKLPWPPDDRSTSELPTTAHPERP